MRWNIKRIGMGVASLAVAVGLSGSVLALPQPSQSQRYVALGDSVAAGAGLAQKDSVCDRSERAYPQLVGRSLGMSVQNLACSGAKADEGIYDEQERSGVTVPEQMDRVFAHGTPELITLTVGANDVRWSQFIYQCYYLRCGYDVDEARAEVYLADFRLELNWVMARIHHESGGNPPVVLVNGYYNPLAGYECVDRGLITRAEAAWMKDMIEELNEVIRETAGKYSFAHYVPVDFSGHGLCSSGPWVQGLNAAAPFHPTADGQQAIAGENVAKYARVVDRNVSSQPDSYRERVLDWFDRNWD